MTTRHPLLRLNNIVTVDVSNIDQENKTFQITTQTDNEDIISSIEHLGVISPPVLKPGKSKHVIIAGFRRIAACNKLYIPQISAKIVQPDTTEQDCIKLAIADNTLQRTLNLVEQARAFHLLWPFYKSSEELKKITASLGLPSGKPLQKKIKKIFNLSSQIQECILDDTLTLAIALELGKLNKEDSIEFAKLFKSLKLSTSKQREILILVREIGIRENISIPVILKMGPVNEILNNNDLDRTQKTRQIRRHLKQRRFPTLTAAENSYQKLLSGLNLNHRVQLNHPKNFEGDVYSLNFSFRSEKELIDSKAEFDRLVHHPGWRKIFKKTFFNKKA